MTSTRDANLVIVALSPHAHQLHAGVGVSGEVIAGPSQTVKTEVSLPVSIAAGEKRKWSDYRVNQQDEDEGWVKRSVFREDDGGLPGDAVTDWKALDAFLRNLLYQVLKLPKPPLSSSLLLSIPADMSPASRDRLTQLCFESLHLPAVHLVETPLLQLLACNAVTGVVVDVGLTSTAISVLYDSIVQETACTTVYLGEQDCDDYLIALLLSANPNLPIELSLAPTTPLLGPSLYSVMQLLVAALKAESGIRFDPALASLKASVAKDAVAAPEEEEGITDVAQAIASGRVDRMKAEAKAAASSTTKKGVTGGTKTGVQGPISTAEVQRDTDTILLPHPLSPSTRPGIAIGPVRHRHSEPLFEPAVLSSVAQIFEESGLGDRSARYAPELLARKRPLLEAVVGCVKKLDPPGLRAEVWEAVVMTGSISRTEGLAAAMVSHLTNNFLPDLGHDQEGKARSPRHAKVPDYFSEFKNKPEWAAFLGGSIVAKVVFADMSANKLWMSKPDYSKEGPFINRQLYAP